MAFNSIGINFSIETTRSESLITRARNLLIKRFWEMEEYTHILFLDADVFLDVNGLLNMLYYQKDVIGAPVALKGLDKNGKRKLNTDADPSLDVKLQSATWLGTAVFMLSRKAVGALVDHAIQSDKTYPRRWIGQDPENPETLYDIFQVGVKDGEYLPEDFWVCKQLKELGFEIFVDTSIYTRHTGIVVFDSL